MATDSPYQAYIDVTGTNNGSPCITITSQPQSTNVACGSNVTFTVSATTSCGALQYQWEQNNVPIPSATTASLNLTDVSALSRGSYTCVLSNNAGSLPSAAATLVVTNCGANLVWQGKYNNNWDETSPNWGFVGGSPTNSVAYGDGDSVIFDDTASDAANNTVTLTLASNVAPANVTFNDANFSYVINGAGEITGGSLVDNQANTTTLQGVLSLVDNVANTYTNGLYINGAIFESTLANCPSNVFINGGELALIGTNVGTFAENITSTNPLSSLCTAGSAAQAITLSGNITWPGQIGVHGGTMILSGSNTFTGVGTVNYSTGMSVFIGNYGQYNRSPTLVIGNSHAIDSGPLAGLVEVNGGPATGYEGTLDLNGFSQTINGLTGVDSFGDRNNLGSSAVVNGQVINSAGVNVTLTLGAGDATAPFPGTISGNINIVKIGAGTQTLSGLCTLGGYTTVSNGTLSVMNLYETTSVDVWGGALGGNGSINSSVNVHPAGTLQLVPNVISTLTIFGSLNLQGTNILNIASVGGLPQSDQLTAYGGLTLGGTLVLNDVGIAPLVVGETFTLFPNGFSGAFSNVILPTDATWDTSSLASAGTVTVLSVYPGATIYQDEFSYGTGLNGHDPDTYGAPLSWIADSSWVGTGTNALNNNTNSANAFLPFVPQAGNEYTLSATIDCQAPFPTNGPGNNFMALGFANGFGTNVPWQGTNNNPVGWWHITPDGDTNATETVYLGPGQNGGISLTNSPAGPHTYAVILNMRNENPNEWFFTFQMDGNTVAGSTAFGANSLPITSVGFGGYLVNSNNTVSNFTLTVAGNAPSAAPRPTLTIAQQGSSVVLTWPTSATGYYLVSSPALGASWTSVGITPTVVGSNNQVIVAITGAAQFFRLVNP